MKIYKNKEGQFTIYRSMMEIVGVGLVVFYRANSWNSPKAIYRALSMTHTNEWMTEKEVIEVGTTNTPFFWWDRDYTLPDGRVMHASAIAVLD